MRDDLRALQKPYMHHFLKVVVPLAALMVALIAFGGIGITSVLSFVVFYFIIYVMGTNIFYHRYWSHKHFTPNNAVLKFFTVAGLFTMIGGPIFYALAHRFHHKHSDDELDPHSPIHGRWHAFAGWIFDAHKTNFPIKMVRDLLTVENRWLLTIDKNKVYIIYLVVIFVGIVSPAILLGLLMAMFTSCFIELFINTWLHDPVLKIAKNATPALCWLTAGGMQHKLHHDNSARTSVDDPAYYIVRLLDTSN